MAEDVRYGERSTAERVKGGLKDNHGGRTLRVRGPAKVMCHLMYGALAQNMRKAYEGAVSADAFAKVVFAMSRPEDVEVNEILLRLTSQDF
jgi:hypothetical protein